MRAEGRLGVPPAALALAVPVGSAPRGRGDHSLNVDLGTLRAIYRQAARFVPESELRPWFYAP